MMMRRMTVRICLGLVLLLLVGTAACGSDETADARQTLQVEGVRTDPGGGALVATYTGGACDGPARLDVQESTDRVELSIRLTDPPQGSETCIALAVGGTVRDDLSSPLGTRAVLADGVALRVFDGADLVVPRPLPAGFEFASEAGSQDRDAWTQTFTNTPADRTTGACDPKRRSFSTQTGPGVASDLTNSYITEEPTVTTRNGPARQFRNEAAALRLLTLNVKGHPVSVAYSADCGGLRPTVAQVTPFLDALTVNS